jgi:BRCA1-associated protein
MANDKQSILMETEKLKENNAQIEQKLNTVIKEKQAIEKRMNAMSGRLAIVLKDLSEERQFSKTLQLNHNSWQTKYSSLEKQYKEKEAEIVELKDQVKDLMFYMEAQNTISKSELKDEIVEGSIFVGESSGNKSKNRRKKK